MLGFMLIISNINWHVNKTPISWFYHILHVVLILLIPLLFFRQACCLDLKVWSGCIVQRPKQFSCFSRKYCGQNGKVFRESMCPNDHLKALKNCKNYPVLSIKLFFVCYRSFCSSFQVTISYLNFSFVNSKKFVSTELV